MSKSKKGISFRQGEKIIFELSSIKWLVAVVFVFILLGLCVWMSCHYWWNHYRGTNLSEQATEIGIISSFFAVIVTLLVGWQIGQSINVSKKLEKAEEENKRYFQAVKQEIATTEMARLQKIHIDEMAISDIYLCLITKPNVEYLEYNYLDHTLQAIQTASIINNFQGCSLLTKLLIDTVKEPSKIILTKHQKKLLEQNLLKIKNQDKIENFIALTTIIGNISTK